MIAGVWIFSREMHESAVMSRISVFRILDASLNRAAEGLRVVEDYLRFAVDDPLLTREAKELRHELAEVGKAISSVDLHSARETSLDVGTEISTSAESTRGDALDVCRASLKRTQQALRSLEEYGKLVSPSLAKKVESLRYRLYTLEKSIDIGRSSAERLQGVTLCVLVDGRDTLADFRGLVETLVAAGVGMIQLRDKRLDDRDLLERARALVNATRGTATLSIVNDRADIALLARADGVHLGQEDLTLKDARVVVGPEMLIGISTHNIDQARQAVFDGANYLGAGPTFASPTKSFDRFAGLDYLRQVAAEIRLPTFAIGGITSKNLAEVRSAGTSRIAVSSAITEAQDSAVAARHLLGMLGNGPEG